ncbi:MAG: hypothetical protein D6696_08695 [Acidobacteria bacterium]|nr:MAG: hypothetical protein D6696_08695 [Acidobacteriota bacterium]
MDDLADIAGIRCPLRPTLRALAAALSEAFEGGGRPPLPADGGEARDDPYGAMLWMVAHSVAAPALGLLERMARDMGAGAGDPGSELYAVECRRVVDRLYAAPPEAWPAIVEESYGDAVPYEELRQVARARIRRQDNGDLARLGDLVAWLDRRRARLLAAAGRLLAGAEPVDEPSPAAHRRWLRLRDYRLHLLRGCCMYNAVGSRPGR